MIPIALFKKRSLFIILLASSTANPLLALPKQSHPIIKRNVKSSYISQKIQDQLINKGLEQEIASKKINKLFQNNKNLEYKLNHIYNSSILSISKEKLNDTLGKYALYEKSLDLNSYSGILGFIQNISMKKLNEKELNAIKDIALLS